MQPNQNPTTPQQPQSTLTPTPVAQQPSAPINDIKPPVTPSVQDIPLVSQAPVSGQAPASNQQQDLSTAAENTVDATKQPEEASKIKSPSSRKNSILIASVALTIAIIMAAIAYMTLRKS